MLSKNAIKNADRIILSDSFTFDYVIENNCLYVDKTTYLYKLVSSPKKLYFFSRPRRFGKSLTLSTLKAIFQGKKELFKDLFIYDQPYEWKSYPIIHLDMGSNNAHSPEKLEKFLLDSIKDVASEYDITLTREYASDAFIELIKKLYKRNGSVVVLIDEYDKPILGNLENENIESLQRLMKGFYGVIKTCEPYERFAFITGVGKFFKVSIFSELNNLNDISMSKDYATMCGYTEKELEENFHGRLADLAAKNGFEYEEFRQEIKKWYDGYRFYDDSETVYNPVSLALFIEGYGKFSNYWFTTGNPSVVLKLLKDYDFDVESAISEEQFEDIFTAFMPTEVDLIPLMYQTGYLTIKETIKYGVRTVYKLGFPNLEVTETFYRRLLNYINSKNKGGEKLAMTLCTSVENGNIDKMMSAIDSYLADVPYDLHIEQEKYYQTIFYIIFKFIGTNVTTEYRTSDGRIDAVIETQADVYIFEFKLNQSSEIALEQIMQKEYYKAHEHKGKKITLIGANFDFKTKRLSEWKKLQVVNQ